MPTHHETYSFELESNRVPVAVVLPEELEVVVGSIVKLDGRSSLDPEGNGLTYSWSFAQTPIGSQVEITGFTDLEEDSSIVSFAPDITGTYKVQLVVDDGSLTSDPAISTIDVRVILVPYHQGIIPDASFIWNYLSDFWALVDGRKKFETFWSGAIQIVASEMLKLYQYDYAKSIRDVQEVIQKRWLAYSPGLKIDRDKVSFILADDQAGSKAATFVYDSETGVPEDEQPLYSNVVIVPLSEGDFSTTAFGSPVAVGRLLQLGGRSFTLKRAQTVQLSQTYGTDGASSGVSTFTGSMFTAEMEGSILRILKDAGSPSLVGDFIIDTVTNATTLIIDAPAGTIWATHSGLTYTILPSPGQHSAFFADQDLVPTALENQPWRLSATMSSDEYDFEALGSSPGDVVEVEISRLGANLTSTFFAQVVSVDRNKVGFVLNLTDLVDGQAAGWMTNDIQATLTADLQVSGLSAAPDGSLIYVGDSAAVKATLSSTLFRRTYFEKSLTPDSEINVGPFSILARPIQVIRNRKLAIDPTIVSVPVLQEYIKQPDVAQEDGKTYFVYDSQRFEVSREPYLLSENLDYVIDDEETIIGTCQVIAGSDEIIIPQGDLLDRSLQEQDTITIQIGITQQVYDIRRVLATDRLRVSPIPDTTSTSASFVIKRRIPGKFIRLIPGSFTKKSPAPKRLWAEVTYFDNNDTIEANFGVMVGILREDLENVGSTIPYKSSVAGLMYALSRGPTVANLELSAQILLGLPFSQAAGIIREINPKFRLRDDGSPRYGRILIEGIDKKGLSTGITYLYLYPQGRQIPDPDNLGEWLPAVPDFSGIALNPDTGVEYVVGDVVRQFTPLSKGVEIEEYLTNSDWAARLVAQGNSAINLQKYHSFNLVVNADLVSSADADLMARFIKKAKAHYTRMSVGLLRSLEDFIDIDDSITFSLPVRFFDMPDALTSVPKVDYTDTNQSFLSLADGVMYTRYLSGEDLVTTYGSSNVTSAGGGFKDARGGLFEEWNSPLLRAGDLLVISTGNNAGNYPITAVTNDNALILNLNGGAFETLTGQEFQVFRPSKNPIWTGSVSVTGGGTSVVPVSSPDGLDSGGVSVGDLFVFSGTGINPTHSGPYRIVSLDVDGPELVVDRNVDVSTGTYVGWVIRDSLLPNGPVAPEGTTPQFYVNIANGDPLVLFNDTVLFRNSWQNVLLLETGSILGINENFYEVLQYDHATRQAYVSPAPDATLTNLSINVFPRPLHPATPVSTSFLDRVPADYLQLDLLSSLSTGDSATTTASSATVDLTVETFSNLGARPGDLFLLLEGPDSTIDVGFGEGAFLIAEITGGGDTALLITPLSSTGTYRYGIRRRVS